VQIRAFKIRAAEKRVREIHPVQIRPGEIRARKVRARTARVPSRESRVRFHNFRKLFSLMPNALERFQVFLRRMQKFWI